MFGLLTVIFLSYSLSSAAQDAETEKGAKTKELSTADKAVIIEIFKTLESKYYYLRFKNNEVYGLKTMQPSAISDVKMGQFHVTSVIAKWYKEIDLLYAIEKPNTADLKTIFGKANASRLNAILTKYTGGN